MSGGGASLDARGTSIDGNRLGGIIVQRGADLQTLQAARLTGNGGVGLALTDTTRVTQVKRCSFAGTFMATFQTDQGMIAVGDGLSMASATGMLVTRSRFDANGRFGILLRDARGSVTNNEGDRNSIDIGAYGMGGLTLANNRVFGAAPMPGAPATAAIGP
ncbi:MAG: right-handed parallel beta-helix repeat-containing protein [Polyangiales bacterium]